MIRILAAASGIAAATAFAVTFSAPANAHPELCPDNWAQINPTIYAQCKQAEANQDYCGSAQGCTPGDPCVVGSPIERAVCGDARLSGQQPRY